MTARPRCRARQQASSTVAQRRLAAYTLNAHSQCTRLIGICRTDLPVNVPSSVLFRLSVTTYSFDPQTIFHC